MASILIITFFFQVFLIVLQKDNFQKLRVSFLKSLLINAVFIWFSTELLSYFNAVNAQYLIIWWISANLLSVIYLFLLFRQHKTNPLLGLVEVLKAKTDWFGEKSYLVLWSLFSLIFILVFITAIIYPPNTVDVLTYHLPRVAHWIQAGNVNYYPTHIDRQIYNGTLAEYVFLHLQLLSGRDYLTNLVQFFSFVSIGVVTSLIAKKFNLNQFGQLLTVFIVSTIPIAILQASSSKNDLVTSLFVCSFFYFYLEAAEDNQLDNYLFAGISLGLALLTKGNAYFYCFPIGLFIFVKYFFQNKFTSFKFDFLGKTLIILAIAVLINSFYFQRNWELYQTPLQGEERLKNEKITPGIIYGNAVRNYATHLGTNFEPVLAYTHRAVYFLIQNEYYNPASTLSGNSFSISQSFGEDSAGNPFHLILLTVAIIYIFFYRGENEKKFVVIAGLAIVSGFIILGTFLKWNPWITRIQLPIFALGSPLIAFWLSKISYSKLKLIGVGFLITATLTLLFSSPRNFIFSPMEAMPPLTDAIYDSSKAGFKDSRTENYFASYPDMGPVYLQGLKFLLEQNPKEIGLDLSTDYVNYNLGDWEYNIWILVKDDFAQAPILRHVGVTNPTKQLEKNDPMPDWVISTNYKNVIGGTEYEQVWRKFSVRVLRKKN